MDSGERWSKIEQLQGWEVCRDFEDALKKAHLKRHPNHSSYLPGFPERLADSESEVYDQLNERLHDQMRSVSQNYFANTPVPEELHQLRSDELGFTPFTYQNYDWYGPSYECYIVVLTDYISADLLRRFQSLLHDEFRDWCIMVVPSDGLDFDGKYEIALFSDQLLVPEVAADAMHVP